LFLDSLFEIRDALLDLIDNQLSGWFERRRQARIGNDLFAVIDENSSTRKKRRKNTDNQIYTYYYETYQSHPIFSKALPCVSP